MKHSAFESFSESALDALDFARCQRPDGTYYGTSGTCRKGVSVGPKEKAALKKAAKAGNKKAAAALAVVEGKKTKAQAKADLKKEGIKVGLKKEEAKKPTKKAAKKPTKKAEEKKPVGDDAAAQRNRLKTKKGREQVDAETKVELRRLEENAALAPPSKEISAKAAATILNYTLDDSTSATGYAKMNTCARNPPSCSEATIKANKQLDSALRQVPRNTEGEALFRGMRLKDNPELADQLANLKPGDTFKDDGFGSYSREMPVARGFIGYKGDVDGRNVIITTRSKKIRFIEEYSDYAEEYEGILPRGTSQTVRSVKNIGNVTYIEVD